MIATFEIPVRTHNPLNGSQFGGINWAKAARRKKERKATRLCCLAFIDALEGIGAVASVTFTRIAPRALDDDGLAASCKSIRDELAAFLGVSDAPRGGVAWRYDQQRGPPKTYAVRISIEVHETRREGSDTSISSGGRPDASGSPTRSSVVSPVGTTDGVACIRPVRGSRSLRQL